MKDICCIGHITVDKIITPSTNVIMPGGTSYYFSRGINCLPGKVSYELVTSVSNDQMDVVKGMRNLGIEVKVFPSKYSIYFENTYGENSDNRKQRVLSKADPFRKEYFENIDAKVFHLGSLLADDFSIDTIEYLSTKGDISIDVQGYLREVQGEKVVPVDWKDKLKALRYTKVLKVNEHEMKLLSGTDDEKESAKQFAVWGVSEVIITKGSYGSLIYADGNFYNIPAYKPNRVVDATGCGDTYSAAYLYCRAQHEGFLEAGKYAAAMCTLKLQHSGPFNGTETDILNVMK